MNQDDRKRKAYKQIAIGLVAVYLFLDLYILHAEVYKYNYPHSGLGGNLLRWILSHDLSPI